MSRVTASVVASVVLLASTVLTWVGVAAIAVFCVIVFDAQRRVRLLIAQMDDVNDRLDAQKASLDDLMARVVGDDEG